MLKLTPPEIAIDAFHHAVSTAAAGLAYEAIARRTGH
jgi:hypothetical protein